MFKSTITAIAICTWLSCPAFAQADSYSAGCTGAQSRQSNTTGGSLGETQPTGPQSPTLPRTSTAGLAPVFGGGNGLPPTSLDSFVQQAGGMAFQIYGDEGTCGPPPISGFNTVNRINSGIQADSAGLTTGHESMLPSAWGKDEFIGGPEMSVSGDGVMRNGQGASAGYPMAGPCGAPGLPGGTPGGGYYDPSGGTFPGACGGGGPGSLFRGGMNVPGMGNFRGSVGPGGFNMNGSTPTPFGNVNGSYSQGF